MRYVTLVDQERHSFQFKKDAKALFEKNKKARKATVIELQKVTDNKYLTLELFSKSGIELHKKGNKTAEPTF